MFEPGAAPRGRGQFSPYDFRFSIPPPSLSAQQLVMAMIIPLPHYDFFFVGKLLKTKKKHVSESPPLSDFFKAGAKCLGSRSSSEAFCPPPPISKHPGAAPGLNHSAIWEINMPKWFPKWYKYTQLYLMFHLL